MSWSSASLASAPSGSASSDRGDGARADRSFPGSTNPCGADADGGDRKLGGQACSAAVGAIEPESAAERLDPVLEPDQASAGADSRAPGAVVSDRDAQQVVGHLNADANDRGA